MEGIEHLLLPPTFTKLFFKKILCSSPDVHQGCLGYLTAYHPRGILKGTRQSRIDRSHPTAVQSTKRCPFLLVTGGGGRTLFSPLYHIQAAAAMNMELMLSNKRGQVLFFPPRKRLGHSFHISQIPPRTVRSLWKSFKWLPKLWEIDRIHFLKRSTKLQEAPRSQTPWSMPSESLLSIKPKLLGELLRLGSQNTSQSSERGMSLKFWCSLQTTKSCRPELS